MEEREEPDLNRVRDALRNHDDRERTDEADDEPSEQDEQDEDES